MTKKEKILVLGANGMLGNTMVRYFAKLPSFDVYGTVRNHSKRDKIKYKTPTVKLFDGVDIQNLDRLYKLFDEVIPDVVINCIGIVKQSTVANNPLDVIQINSLLPHQIALVAEKNNARFVQISTDCVFSGLKGNYVEDDIPDAQDLYGRSKFLGEVDYSHAITLRTSILGHELFTSFGLIEWFLSQKHKVSGYRKAVFSGLPAVEIARIISEFVIPNKHLKGTYHLSAIPINKYDLLNLVAQIYEKKIEITPFDNYVIDRSLNSERFNSATGFNPKSWIEMIKFMHDFEYI